MMFHKNAEQQKPTFTGTVTTGVEAKEKRTSVVSLIGDEKNEKQKRSRFNNTQAKVKIDVSKQLAELKGVKETFKVPEQS